jgi:hypothetical protein
MKIGGLFLSTLGVMAADDLPKVDPEDFIQYWEKMPVDHFNYQNSDTFGLRVWKNEKFATEKDAPVFLYLCGEYTCEIRQDRLFPFMVGASHGAELYAIEHRFYGKSVPYANLHTPNLRLLSTEQALSDIATFVEGIKSKHPKKEVVVIGGSYPGALSAWFRQRYPHLAVASWSSSGVVYPIRNFWKFDEQVYKSTVKSGELCPAVINTVFKKVTDTLTKGTWKEQSDLKNAMGANEHMHNGDFAFFFADIFVESVQYGDRTGLCDLMKELSGKDFDKQLAGLKKQAEKSGVAPGDYCRNKIKDTVQVYDNSARSWTYQYCTEFGFWQIPSKEHPMRPEELLGEEYWKDYCFDIFGIHPSIKRSVTEFAGPHTAGSNVLITNGGEDPWQWATELNPDASLNQKGLMADCEDCGHCAELYTPKEGDKDELKEVRSQAIDWIATILTHEEVSNQFLQ